MADGDGGMLVQQEHGHGLSHDVAPAHDDGVFSGNGNRVASQNLDNARGSTRARSRQIGYQPADVAGVKAIDVFFWRHGEQNSFTVDLYRQRQLYQDAIDIVARI